MFIELYDYFFSKMSIEISVLHIEILYIDYEIAE